jgi:hypothetical protein
LGDDPGLPWPVQGNYELSKAGPFSLLRAEEGGGEMDQKVISGSFKLKKDLTLLVD